MNIESATQSAGPVARSRRPRARSIDRAAMEEAAGSFRGELIRPGDPRYDELRKVWNGSIDRRPAVIARCASESDVIAAVRLGRRTRLPVAVRSGGHSFPGISVCDDGIVIDLRAMQEIRVDPASGIVRVQAGILLGELDRATQAYGLAVPVGAVSHTGLAGLTLGGGIGWLMRKHGLTIDHLLSVTLVSADGEVVTASAGVNPDLFWGVRGGGGNFGIVTEFAFRMVPVGPEILGGVLAWPLDDAAEVARFYRDWCSDLPDEMTTALVYRKAPAIELFPVDLHGRSVVEVVCCWSGPLDAGERLLEPMRRFGRPVLDLCARRPYVEMQSMLDPSFPHGLWAYLRACDMAELTDEILDITLEHARRIESGGSLITIWQLGGAVERVHSEMTAFGSRSAGHVFNITGATESIHGFERERDWVRNVWNALAPHETGVYVNFLMDEGERRVREAYGTQRYERLRDLKRHYDPDNFFRLNQNIDPGGPNGPGERLRAVRR